MVVSHRIDRRDSQNLHDINAVIDRPFHHIIDVALQQVIGVFVIAAEHAAFVVLVKDGETFFKDISRRPFPDLNLNALFDVLKRLVTRKTFMVCRYSGGYVSFEVISTQAGGMTVHRFRVFRGNTDFVHNLLVAV